MTIGEGPYGDWDSPYDYGTYGAAYPTYSGSAAPAYYGTTDVTPRCGC
ncbi:MAG TPA: hypothetical protein VED87_11050 [Methylocystis sp.]|nr:hypothetical protein [Methylocystis sp.]